MPIMQCDFHSHSLCSDGSLSPEDLALRMHEAKVDCFALTDHDTIEGIERARQAAHAVGRVCIPGVEISCRWASRDIHMVGLAFDPVAPALTDLLARQRDRRIERALKMAERLEKHGAPGMFEAACAQRVPGADHAPASAEPCPGRPHFARALVAAGHCRDETHAFQRFLAQGKPAYVATDWPTLAEAVAVLRVAGGVAVLAHPLHYRLTRTRLEALVREFSEAGGQAMEVSGVNQDPLQRRMLGLLCEKYRLHGSQASDYHGASMPWIRLGNLPPLPPGVPPVTELFGRAS